MTLQDIKNPLLSQIVKNNENLFKSSEIKLIYNTDTMSEIEINSLATKLNPNDLVLDNTDNELFVLTAKEVLED